MRKLFKLSVLILFCLPFQAWALMPGMMQNQEIQEQQYALQHGATQAAQIPQKKPEPTADEKQAFLQADKFDYDQKNDIFTATGHVDLAQDGQIVKADQMIYDKKNDTVYATGHVVFIDKSGQVYFADKVKMEQKMKTAVTQQMGLMFSDGSRFAARQGIQKDENTIVMEDGVYSPCDLCKDDPHKAPLWQLRANKMVHLKDDRSTYYHNVKFDAYGHPVMYVPYFSHPDPDVKARSGFLMPKFITDSKNGFMLRNYYYKNFSPSEDATFELSPTTNSGTVYGMEYRHTWSQSSVVFNGSANYSAIRSGSGDVLKDEKMRGHIFTDAYTRLDQDWTTGFTVQHTFDDYYLKDFDFSQADVLQNDVYLQYIHGRDYGNINATSFQDLRRNISQDQPDILPWIQYNPMGDPNQMLGGRWNIDNETVTLFRNGDQSVSRITTIPTWERRDVLPLGLQSIVNAKLHTDGYWIRQGSSFDQITPNDPDIDRTIGRFAPSTQGTLSYPLVRPGASVTSLIEPKVALTVAPQDTNNDKIPNEDSRDVQVDISNLFSDNRFPGNDRIENGSHAAYGVKMGGYENSNGNSAFLTLGQSYRLTSNNPFPDGSGYEEDASDYVGQLETTFYDRFYTDYRFQMNSEDFGNQRHELEGTYLDDKIELRTNYVYTEQVAGTGLQNRQQLGFSGAKALNKKWAASVETLSDLNGGGLLKSGLGIQYKNECVRVSFRGEKDLTDNINGGADTRFLFSLGLRNLGGYDTPLLENDPLYQPFGTKSKI